MKTQNKRTLIKNGTIVTQNKAREILVGDVLIEGTRITKIGRGLRIPPGAKVIDASGQFVIPGLIQAHTHLCQALFRGLADDLVLLDWLKKKIWPFEHSHNSASLRASAQIGLLEMQLLGTTAILDMGTVRNTHILLDEAAHSQMRYWGGKCLMDLPEYSGPLFEKTEVSLRETEELIGDWHQKTELMNYALCPRFAVSCTDEIMEAASSLQKSHNLVIHTHASENLDEIAIIRERTGLGNVDYFDSLNMLNSRTVLAHGVHMSDQELDKMVLHQTPLAHCPSSNLKLASGVAPIHKYIERGLTVGLGSDGAPCNNTMDPFSEMRLAALLQKPQFGPEALPAQRAFDMATLHGAKAVGSLDKIGSIEVGKQADIVTVDRDHPSVATVENPYSALVYSCSGRDVRHVFINGFQVVKNKTHTIYDREKIIHGAKVELKKLLRRM